MTTVPDSDRVDAGLADAEYVADARDVVPIPVDVAAGDALLAIDDVQVETRRELTQDERTDVVLYNPNINAKTKILMLIMARGTAPWSAEVLAQASGMTRSEVQHALRSVVAVGAVTSSEDPDYDTKKFVTRYRVTSRSVGYLAGLATPEPRD